MPWCKNMWCLTHLLGFWGYSLIAAFWRKTLAVELQLIFKLFSLPWIKAQTPWNHTWLPAQKDPWVSITQACTPHRDKPGGIHRLPGNFPHCALLNSLGTLVPHWHHQVWQEFYFCVVLKPLKELPESGHKSSFMRSALSHSKVNLFSSKVHILFPSVKQI